MTKKDTQAAISLTEMVGGSKVKMQYYGPNSLNEDGTFMPFNEQMAIISHYLHNEGTPYGNTYEKKALGLMEDIYKAKSTSKSGIAADFNEAQRRECRRQRRRIQLETHRVSYRGAFRIAQGQFRLS